MAWALFVFTLPDPLAGQSRFWRPEERTFIADLSTVTAVAATPQVVYVATLNGLASYDLQFAAWRETAGPLEGFPRGIVTAMAADPLDELVWLAQQGRWIAWQPFSRRFDSGNLPGQVRQIVLDAQNPSAGAYFATSAGWYFVARGAFAAEPSAPPRSAAPGAIGPEELRRTVPAFDAIRSRIESDEQLRRYRITSAARVPLLSSVVVGTDGNGAFLVDGAAHDVRRLPAGLAGDRPTTIAVHRGMICAGAARRGGFATARTAITCFDETLRDRAVYEDRRGLGLPGSDIRRLLITDRVIWAATDAGLVRVIRGRDEVDVVTTTDGLAANETFALAPSAAGVWAGTSHGLAQVVDSGRSARAERGLASAPVLSLANAGDTLLVGTMAGLALLLPLDQALRPDAATGPSREPVLALASSGGRSVAVTARRILLREGGAWRAVEPGRHLGELAAVAADSTGFWIAGSLGLAFYDPDNGRWLPTMQDDVIVPVRDIAVSRGYVWVVTDAGLVRFERRLLLP